MSLLRPDSASQGGAQRRSTQRQVAQPGQIPAPHAGREPARQVHVHEKKKTVRPSPVLYRLVDPSRTGAWCESSWNPVYSQKGTAVTVPDGPRTDRDCRSTLKVRQMLGCKQGRDGRAPVVLWHMPRSCRLACNYMSRPATLGHPTSFCKSNWSRRFCCNSQEPDI